MRRAALEITMLSRLRSSRGVRLALCAGALLSIVAAFGLHPEPDGTRTLPGSVTLSAKDSAQPAAHECPACVTCGSALLAAPGGVVLFCEVSVPASAPPAASAPSRQAGRDLSGRSPPRSA